MTAAALQAIREEAKSHIDNADERTVRMVIAMLEAAEEEDDAYFAEIDRRTKEYERGEVRGYTLNEVEEEAMAYAKEKLKNRK
ncbi:hypothetical protein CAP35_11715 [Chitinophagaceae bacterium IBVUCB1]|nr:hypothetical protein CAP35_11715 [Chitinophagaceae bacterium IBVUCB1]